MIDETKIKKAAESYASFDSGMRAQENYASFADGAHWAIKEFLKDLWHGIKEEPKKGKWIVTRYLNDDNDYVYEVDINTSTTPWKEYARKYRITQWLYIDDLLPKDRD